jgi:hypothetical protein
MLHVDLPTRSEIDRLLNARDDASVSIYLPTTPITPDAQADRIELKNLRREALDRLKSLQTHKRQVDAIGESLEDLVEDDSFWSTQARSLAIFCTPDRTITFRLPNTLTPVAKVSDRFHVKPLLRAVTFPQSAFILALAQGAVRLIEFCGDVAPHVVKVDGMPTDVASAVGVPSILGRAPMGRIQGSEGQRVYMRMYARRIDSALRDLLGGRETPLILAATDPMESIYRSVNTYPHLAAKGLEGSPEKLSDAQLAERARVVLDGLHADELRSLHEEFSRRTGERRTMTDLSDIARAVTNGSVQTLFVDMDAVVPGALAEADGALTYADDADPGSYGVLDEIARRAWLTGARVLAVRAADVPGGRQAAAILRYAP